MAAIENEKVYALKIRESADDGSDFGTPDADYRFFFIGEDGDLHLKDSSDTVTDFPAGGGGGGSGATGQMNQLGSDVSISSGTTWFDGPSLSLAAGTYIVFASLLVIPSSAGRVSGRITDGTTHLASTEAFQGTNAREVNLSMVGYVVVGSTTTWKAQAAVAAGNTGTIKAANPTNATGNIASTLVALKIA